VVYLFVDCFVRGGAGGKYISSKEEGTNSRYGVQAKEEKYKSMQDLQERRNTI